MTVRELLERIDSRELSEWMAYDRISLPDSWYQTAQICCVLVNCLGSGKKTFQVEDFLPRRRKKNALDGALPAEGLKSAMARYREATIK